VFAGVAALSVSSGESLLRSAARKGNRAKSFIAPYLHAHRHGGFTGNTNTVNQLFRRYTAMVALLFIVGSITPAYIADSALAGEYGDYYVDTTPFQSGILTDGDGYLTKMNPQTNRGDRTGMTDNFTHIVRSGETLSTIASLYGLKTNTLLWENGLSNANSLKIGQKLVVPPVDGVTHNVSKGETIDKIAKKYKIDPDLIKRQNGLIASNNVTKGAKIFIPSGKPLPVTPSRTTPARIGTSSRAVSVGSAVSLSDAGNAPVGDKPFIVPTRGIVTQGYHRGHYAVDLADASKPPIWAAGSGKVIKASSGTWGGGYGNHVIIDHGNGLKTLYAHLDYLSVGVGDVVDQGQVIGRMGNTGRVFGRTGIHLHFEVIKNGIKQVPYNYY